jgi:hypothetical protein
MYSGAVFENLVLPLVLTKNAVSTLNPPQDVIKSGTSIDIKLLFGRMKSETEVKIGGSNSDVPML